MSNLQRSVPPCDVAATLTVGRPPACRSLRIEVLANAAGDITSLEDLLQAVVTEVVTSWPDSTIWIFDLDNGYLQGWHELPTMLLEYGGNVPLSTESWIRANERGWIDPRSVPKGHPDFESRAAWGENPVMEVDWSDIGIPRIVELLADAVDEQLRATRDAGLIITIFCREPDDTEAPEVSEAVSMPVPSWTAADALTAIARVAVGQFAVVV